MTVVQFKEAIKIKPNNEKAYFLLCDYYKNMGYFKSARDLLESFLKLDPDNCEAYIKLG